jgi:hypothetical protein
MADFYMHAMLADDVARTSKLKLNTSLVKMGAQGPDPYYFNALNIHKIQSLGLADDMHDHRINDMLMTMLEEVKKHYSIDLYSFFIGFLSHYALDTILHPYIYHYTGDYHQDNIKSITHRGLHVKFERRVDIHFIKLVFNQQSHRYPVCQLTFEEKEVPLEITALMEHVAKSVYQNDLGGLLYAKGYRHMQQTCKRYVQDRFGIKKTFLSFVDLFNQTERIHLRDLSYHNYDEHFDYLNLNHNTWYHPVTHQPFTFSVPELYVRSYYRTLTFIDRCSEYIFNHQKTDFKALFGNLSFNSGIDVNLNMKMTHFNLFNQKKKLPR